MKKTKDGKIIFDDVFELNQEIRRKIKPKLDEVRREVRIKATQEALELMLPITCNCIYEAYGFGKKRQTSFLEYFRRHIECLDQGVTDLDDYRQWCEDNKIKYLNVEEHNELSERN